MVFNEEDKVLTKHLYEIKGL